MRISDWSSDVCSSDLISAVRSACDRCVRRGVSVLLAITFSEFRIQRDTQDPTRLRTAELRVGFRQELPRHRRRDAHRRRSEEHTSELQSLMRISYAVFCLKKKKKAQKHVRLTHTLLY